MNNRTRCWCKGSAFLVSDQETHWFLLVLFTMAYKKSVDPTIAVPLVGAFALPLVLKRQREAHAEYKIALVLYQ